MACVLLSRALVASVEEQYARLEAIARAIINLWRWPPELRSCPRPYR